MHSSVKRSPHRAGCGFPPQRTIPFVANRGWRASAGRYRVRSMRTLLAGLALVFAFPVLADVSPEEVATIQTEQAKATQAIDDKYAAKGKLSAADLRAMSKEKAAAVISRW